MNKICKPMRSIVSAAVLGVITSSGAHAAGFSLYTESNGYSSGNYGAGVAAEAYDASTGWYNPAGLALIRDKQIVLGGNMIFPKTGLSGTSTFSLQGLPNFVQSFDNLNAPNSAFVPSMHYAQPLGENATFGLSVVSPFGLATEYGVDSPVRYAATFTELMTINVSPEIGGRITDNLALGAGIDLQYAQVKFNQVIGVPNLFVNTPFPNSILDSTSYNKGHSYGVGFHAGVMTMFNDNHSRVGLNYQSRMKQTFHGYSVLSGPLAGPGNLGTFLLLNPSSRFMSDNLFSNDISLPEVVTLSGYHDVNDKFALLGSVVYTGWSTFQQIVLNNVAAPVVNTTNGNITQASVSSTASENYKNVWRFAIGANYKVNELFMLRVGGGYDQTPTNDVDRDVRLPDASRWALAVGAHYQAAPSLGFDVGYTHLFGASESTINKTNVLTPTSSYTVNASGNAHADIIGVQANWLIDGPQQPMATK